jgi:class 3 adenylate cyclase
MLDDDVAGIAVHIASRVMHEARSGEVLASSTVKDLVVGSTLRFDDRGDHVLRGVSDPWRLYALER